MESKSYLPKDHVDILPCMAAFAVVVETGSFVEASVRIGVTASAVSKQITKLENILSLRLIERTTRSLKVNAEGEQIYEYCKLVLESSANIFRVKDKLVDNPQGLVRMGVPKSLYATCSKLIPGFLSAYRDVNVQLVCGERFDFVTDSIDVGIIVTEKPPEGMVARRLFDVDFVLCSSASYISKVGLIAHPSELAAHSCIPFVGDLDKQYWKFRSSHENCDVPIPGRYLSDCPEAALTATISGVGVSCLPVCLAIDALRSNQLIKILPDWIYKGALQGTAWMVYQPGHHVSKRIKVLVQYVMADLSRLSTTWKLM
ncbi:LysR family transcriptional regulator [Pseudomonas sp. CM25]|uniref:LysR family transcriptional regulator n=1 Tax=Pseudomonas sp. CM25 TaxID=2738448 RepID=UPI00155567D1|nr:LysR family transcriptional regulator [Pseudomonas sp. CM25]NQD57361.1 LysR family transcriptional regulator [Pseudomonas sp. CM25]